MVEKNFFFNMIKNKNGIHPNGFSCLFDPTYYKYKTHIIILNDKRTYPYIIGSRIPDYNSIFPGIEEMPWIKEFTDKEIEGIVDSRREYGYFFCLVFLPWQSISDFESNSSDGDPNWWNIFLKYLNTDTIPSWVLRVLENMQNCHNAFNIEVTDRPDTFPLNDAKLKEMEKAQKVTEENMNEMTEIGLDLDTAIGEEILKTLPQHTQAEIKLQKKITQVQNLVHALDIDYSGSILKVESNEYKKYQTVTDLVPLNEDYDVDLDSLEYPSQRWTHIRHTRTVLENVDSCLANLVQYIPHPNLIIKR